MQIYFFKDNSYHNSYVVLQLQDINSSVNVLKNWTPPPVIYLSEYTNTPTGSKEAPPLQKETFLITPQAQKHFFLPCCRMRNISHLGRRNLMCSSARPGDCNKSGTFVISFSLRLSDWGITEQFTLSERIKIIVWLLSGFFYVPIVPLQFTRTRRWAINNSHSVMALPKEAESFVHVTGGRATG